MNNHQALGMNDYIHSSYKKTKPRNYIIFHGFDMLDQSNEIQNRITTFNSLINKHCHFKKIYIILYKVLLKQNNKRIMF